MTITELIKKLEEIKSEFGNLKLHTNDEKFSAIVTEDWDSINFPGYKVHTLIVWENDNN